MRFVRSAYLGLLLVLPLTLGAWVLPAAPGPAPAVTPTIIVAPDSALVSRQTVTVEGSGYVPGTDLLVAECVAGTNWCTSFTLQYLKADGSGAYTTNLVVARGITAGADGIVDCAAAPGTCEVVVFANGDQVTTPLTFDSAAVPTRPSAVVSPNRDLADRQTVLVQASGFAPAEPVSIRQCVAGAPWCASEWGLDNPADGAGQLRSQMWVLRDLPADSLHGPADCAVAIDACVLRVVSMIEPLAFADVGLGFDPTGTTGPKLVVTPSGPWVEGQVVTVSGARFTPDALLGVGECSAALNDVVAECDRSVFDPVYADDAGAFTLTFAITRTLVPRNGPPIDCVTVEGGCVLLAARVGDWAERVAIPIVFPPLIAPAFTG